MTPPDGRPATRWSSVPLMWFVVGLPLTVVVAAFATLAIAVKSSDVVVRDDFRKDGLAIYTDPGRDAAAAAIGAEATLAVDAVSGSVRVQLSLARGEPPDGLVLVLSHATRAELDRMITLRRVDAAFVGSTEPLPPGHWYVEITPPDRGWRLKGDFRDTAAGIRLAAPAVS
jgi:hypothetical protein